MVGCLCPEIIGVFHVRSQHFIQDLIVIAFACLFKIPQPIGYQVKCAVPRHF